MTTDLQRASATIYTFPARGRFAVGRFAVGRSDEAQSSANVARVAQAAVGSGWYHDEAIREEEAPRKN